MRWTNGTRLTLILFCLITLTGWNTALACTGILLKGKDGTVVFGRTQEWGKFDLKPQIAIYPHGTEFQAIMSDGSGGKSWKSEHGFAGVLLMDRVINTGMNDAGLAGGMFYHKGFAEYAKYNPALADKSIAPSDLLAYILSSCTNIDEVKDKVDAVKVVPVVDPTLKAPFPLHGMIVDPKGNSIVIEFQKGNATYIEKTANVITNNPTYDWHLTNLRNYGKLSSAPFPDTKWGDLDITPLSGGSGLIGLPGDYTSISRFVRAVLLLQTARQTSGGEDTIQETFRILDSFNLPATQSEGAQGSKGKTPLLSGTQYTILTDTKNKTLYYHTMRNRRVRKVDLQQINFDLRAPRMMPLDKANDNGIQDVTDSLR
ncbi:linear amide C-N hydrolase [Pseudodesulfovibrio senegalensis]|uniref:Linear amide C-N hydrolase n=1 Tax=Pseudodesulfovibrio senegalensis TaxID=1721087 RepID=A0A6N6N4U3_9BACT|nr:linear amide C-N hydrolase [Pseudodesulfovibrio senegalensis]KAB1442248.1 linear amide C-N hydrolase [Pseudodesulfovibrio senegalensis]